MEAYLQGRYWHYLPDKPIRKDLLLGWRQKKGDPWILVEDNLINRMVLGLDYTNIVTWNPGESRCLFPKDLMPFQVADVRKMYHLQNCLNANPMGLGKTVETIKYLQSNNAKCVLIVCPKIIREQWKEQLFRWGNLKAKIYDGQSKVTPGIWIVNYDKLRNESTCSKFKNFQWEFLVLDEAHKIKSRSAKQTLAVKNIPAARRVALTGTPILRYVDDLWSILNFLDPRYTSKSYYTFVDYFCKQQHTPWGDKIVGLTDNAERVALLNKLLDLISIRNASVNVAQGKTHEVVKLPMSKVQRDLYRKEKQLLLDELPEHCTIANGAVLTLRLMQTTSWPGLYLGDKEVGPKFEWILELLQNNPEEKIVVFSVFEKTVSALVSYLNENKVRAVKITGKQNATENENSRKKFISQGQHSARVLAGTIGAMGQGYDGLQRVSHTMVFIDRDWSPEILKQAEDRLHRMGQEHLVNIYYLECTGSFDQHVGRINRTKADDIRSALNDEE